MVNLRPLVLKYPPFFLKWMSSLTPASSPSQHHMYVHSKELCVLIWSLFDIFFTGHCSLFKNGLSPQQWEYGTKNNKCLFSILMFLLEVLLTTEFSICLNSKCISQRFKDNSPAIGGNIFNVLLIKVQRDRRWLEVRMRIYVCAPHVTTEKYEKRGEKRQRKVGGKYLQSLARTHLHPVLPPQNDSCRTA